MQIEEIKKLTLSQVENFWREGVISELSAQEYVNLWNAGPHFCTVKIMDGGFRMSVK